MGCKVIIIISEYYNSADISWCNQFSLYATYRDNICTTQWINFSLFEKLNIIYEKKYQQKWERERGDIWKKLLSVGNFVIRLLFLYRKFALTHLNLITMSYSRNHKLHFPSGVRNWQHTHTHILIVYSVPISCLILSSTAILILVFFFFA